MASATVAGGGPGATGLGEGAESAFPAAFNCRVSSGTGEQRRAQPRGDVTPWHRLACWMRWGGRCCRAPRQGSVRLNPPTRAPFGWLPAPLAARPPRTAPGPGGEKGTCRARVVQGGSWRAKNQLLHCWRAAKGDFFFFSPLYKRCSHPACSTWVPARPKLAEEALMGEFGACRHQAGRQPPRMLHGAGGGSGQEPRGSFCPSPAPLHPEPLWLAGELP